jgi:hypothetical protein
MLKVVKITEGGIDLETKAKLPRALVISNGHREVDVPANDIVISEVIALLAENGGPRAVQEHVTLDDASRYAEPRSPRRNVVRPPPSPQPVYEAGPSPFVEEEEGPQMSDDDGFEPGEEFDDGGTGASSL